MRRSKKRAWAAIRAGTPLTALLEEARQQERVLGKRKREEPSGEDSSASTERYADLLADSDAEM